MESEAASECNRFSYPSNDLSIDRLLPGWSESGTSVRDFAAGIGSGLDQTHGLHICLRNRQTPHWGKNEQMMRVGVRSGWS